MTMLRRGRLIPVPPVEKAERFLKAEGLLDSPPGRRLVLGAPETVRAGLEAAAAEYGAEEVIVVGITYDHAARRALLRADRRGVRAPRAARGCLSTERLVERPAQAQEGDRPQQRRDPEHERVVGEHGRRGRRGVAP